MCKNDDIGLRHSSILKKHAMLAIRRTFRFNAVVVRRIMRRSVVRLSALISIGFMIGFTLTMCFQTLNNLDVDDDCSSSALASIDAGVRVDRELIVDARESIDDSSGSSSATTSTTIKNGFVFIGVMTAKKFLSTRAAVINQTWAQTVPGQMAFFVGDNVALDSEDAVDLPLVRLPRVDDSYPPQKKSFLMLKYMYDNYLDQFEWFVRADDDVYLRMDKLEVFLRSLNSSRPLYVGQAGLGTPEEYGMLNLGDEENYCMGGPGIVMSRETVKRVGPHIKECLKNLYTNHEDVELGRCVKRYADVSCTWSYEVSEIFASYCVQAAFWL